MGCRQHHTIADVALDTCAHDPAGNQIEGGLHAIDHQRVAGVVATLKAHHALCRFGQPVHQLALAFIAPLGTDNHNVASSSSGLFFDHHVLLVKNGVIQKGIKRRVGALQPAIGRLTGQARGHSQIR